MLLTLSCIDGPVNIPDMTLKSLVGSFFTGTVIAGEVLSLGAQAPLFSAKNHAGAPFSLADRKGNWTVLYFYPKDDTPGCTKQACAFRDSIDVIRKRGAEVFGISRDSVENHRKFIEKHKLTFPLLSDAEGSISKAYGADGMFGFSKRWTFIVDPELRIRWIQRDVDPAMNASEVASELDRLVK
jgi:thioredoxin-dependent peroxiredoxin